MDCIFRFLSGSFSLFICFVSFCNGNMFFTKTVFQKFLLFVADNSSFQFLNKEHSGQCTSRFRTYRETWEETGSVARLGYLSQIGLLLASSCYFFLGVATSHKLGYFSVWEFWATFGLLFTKITFFCNCGKLSKGLFSRNITDKPQLSLEK